MLKPIFIKNQINIIGIKYLFNRYIKTIVKINFIFVITFTVNFLLSPTVYHSKVSFYANYSESSQGSLAGILPSGILGGGLGYNNLSFSIQNYLSSELFLLEMVNDKYIIDDKKISLTERWGSNYNDFLTINPLTILKRINFNLGYNSNLSSTEKKEIYASSMLKNSLKFSEDRRSLLNTISINIKGDPKIGKQILEKVYRSIITFSSDIVNIKASEKKEFILNRLLEVETSLESAENEMLKFSQENKQIQNSPILILTQQRLQKDITLYNQLYFTLSDQLELAKINEKDNTTSFFLLEKPITLRTTQQGSFASNLLQNLLFLNFTILTLIIFVKRKELIHL